ncbi:MAG: adenylate kinase [Clostridia bacterium]|nr:adenylate kinase [Clostridia bacterium]
MKKVIVIGCPGSGKSVFSRALHDITGLPLYHIDMLRWREDRSFISREELIEKLKEIGTSGEWIMDGNYGATMEMRMSMCDTIIFLDYPAGICLDGITARLGTKRPDMPWADPDKPDEEFIEFVKNYNTVNRPNILERIRNHSDKTVITFGRRKDADAFLNTLKQNQLQTQHNTTD